MNVFYFVKRFPRRYKTSNEQKIFSIAETFLNEGYKVNFVSADLSHPKEYEHLKKYPLNLVHVSSKRISASLSAAQIKPDIALFNSFEMEEMYSAYMYNKWNKCPRVLEVNKAVGLEKWRKSKYSANSASFLVPYNEPLYDQKIVFTEPQNKAMLRSDFYITPNDFLYHLVKNHTKQPQKISLLTHGYPIKQYRNQVKKQEFRPFESRKHFVFVGDLSNDHSQAMIYFLINNIWPEIKKELPEAELHIYSSGSSKQNLTRAQMESTGVFMKGYVEDLEIIQKYKVMLYPAKWSVSMKSKVIESWLHHTPVVTSPVGAQGMFFQMLEAKYAQSQSEHDSGFISQRQYTQEEKQGEFKVNSYYNANSLLSPQLKKLTFGGSFMNYSHHEFAKSALDLYKNKQKWETALKVGQKTLLKNQSQNQLQINLGQAMAKLQLAVYKTRGDKGYQQEWKRVMKNKQYEKKVHQYP